MLTDYANEEWQTLWEEQLIPSFEDETGIRVRPDHGRPEFWFLQLIEGQDWPDVNTSSFALVCDVEAHSAVEPVTELLGDVRNQLGDSIVPPYASPSGEDLQIPYGYQVDTFLYRSDVYDQLDLAPPTSFAEVLSNARAIEESDVDISGYQVAGGPTSTGPEVMHSTEDEIRREFQAYLPRMGVPPSGLRYRNPGDDHGDLEIHFPEREVTALLEFLRELSRLSAVPFLEHHNRTLNQLINAEAAQIVQLNNWPAGIAGFAALQEENATVRRVAETTGIAPLPYWQDGGVSRSDAWLGAPRLDAFHLFSPGENTTGARRWLDWLFADRFDRTAELYTPAPTRYVPNYADVFDSETYRRNELFEAFPRLRDQIDYIHDTIRTDHYGQRTEEVVDSPVGLYVKQQPFFAEMVYRAVTSEDTPQEAYEFGRARLEARLAEARERL